MEKNVFCEILIKIKEARINSLQNLNSQEARILQLEIPILQAEITELKKIQHQII